MYDLSSHWFDFLVVQAAGRRLAQVPADAAAAKPASKLAPECDALVRLAEPGDVYAHYNTAMSAAAISTQIKTIEQRLGLKVIHSLLQHADQCLLHCHTRIRGCHL